MNTFKKVLQVATLSLVLIPLVIFFRPQAPLADGSVRLTGPIEGCFDIERFAVGLYDDGEGSLDITPSGTISEAYIEWVGVEDETPTGDGTSTITINGIEVVGTLAPGDAGSATNPRTIWYSWHADIGPDGYGLITGGDVTLDISGWDNTAVKTNGAVVTVIYDVPGCETPNKIQVLTGVEFNYYKQNPLTELIVYTYAPADYDREALIYLTHAGTDFAQTECRGSALWMKAGPGTAPGEADYNLAAIDGTTDRGYGINGGVEIANDPFTSASLPCTPALNIAPDQAYEAGHPYPGGASSAPYHALELLPADGGFIEGEISNVTIKVIIPANSSWTAFQMESEPDQDGESGGFGGSAFVMKQAIADLELDITVDNDIPEVDENVTFTITIINQGPDKATNVTVNTIFHDSLGFISSDAPADYDDALSTWTIGDLAVNETQTLTVTRSVDAEDTFESVAQVQTSDQRDPDSTPGNGIIAEDDHNAIAITASESSGGGDGGIESNGNRASLLARRMYTRQQAVAKKAGLGITTPLTPFVRSIESDPLKSLIPDGGPLASQAFIVSPNDLIGYTNAEQVFSVDYILPNNRRLGALFTTATPAGELYEHSKNICDRLAGATLEEIRTVEVDGHPFIMSKLVHTSGAKDYAITFELYRNGTGYTIDNRATLAEYDPPADGSAVYNFQIWSVKPEYTIQLAAALIEQVTASGTLTWLNTHENKPVAPAVFIRSSHYRSGKLYIEVENPNQASEVTLHGTTALVEDGERTHFEQTLSLPTDAFGPTFLEVETGAIFDIGFVVENNLQDGLDELYVADGPWSRSFDRSGASISNFSTSEETTLDSADPSSFVVERGASLSGTVSSWATLFRYFNPHGRPADLSAYDYIEFTASGTGAVQMVIEKESIADWDHYSKSFQLTETPHTYRISYEQLRLATGFTGFTAEDVRLLAFYMNGNGEDIEFSINIENVTFGKSENGEVYDFSPELPDELSLQQNFPNPFNPTTNISFWLPEQMTVTLEIYDMLGRPVRTLIENEAFESGNHTYNFDALDLPSGAYFYRITTPKGSRAMKMTLLR